jgi:hypothetical protein
MSELNSASDTIVSALVSIDERLDQDISEDEKKKLRAAKVPLGLELAEIGRRGLIEASHTIAAQAKKLEAIIASVNTVPFAKYFAALGKAVSGLNARPGGKPRP